jgi:CheY-like chemotaxis protein
MESLVALLDAYDTTGTTNPHEALALVTTGTFHVMVCDWQMPAMTGVEALRRARILDPTMSCLLLTAAIADLRASVTWPDRRRLSVLDKGTRPHEIVQRIERLARQAAALKRISARPQFG